MRRLALAPTLVCAFLSPQAAFGIGLGDIELQSALNQPLDAEIPLRGLSAGEGDDVVVALASEEAFRRVGLQRPFSLTHLQFAVHERDGSHYIQISSHEPVAEPFLSFLIEVDAPEGNLLREYTVLLDPPVFASTGPEEAASSDERAAPSAESRQRPADDADATAMRGRIAPADAAAHAGAADAATGDAPISGSAGVAPAERESGDDSQRTESAGLATADGASAPDPTADEGEFGDTPLFLQVAREEEEAERRLAERARASVGAATTADASSAAASRGEAPEPAPPDEYGAVERGETLWDIAEQLRQGEVSVQQMMIALLRYNPEAFEDGNINRLKEGYVLTVPDAEAVRSLSVRQAIASVREHNGLWREWRDSLESGGAARLASTQDMADTAGEGSGADESADTGAATGGDSRLEIVGADDGGATSDESASATASTEAGTSEELEMAREELASVRAERAELADRVAHLEDTVDKMEQLVTVREEQLARLQQQLEELQADNGSIAAAGETGAASAADGVSGDENSGDEAEDSDAAAAAAGGGAGGSGAAPGDGAPGSGEATSAAGDDGNARAASAADTGGQDTGARDAAAQTRAGDEPQPVTPTQSTPPQQSWLDTIFGYVASVGALVSGTLAAVTSGGLSPVVLGVAAALVLALLMIVRRRRAVRAQADEEAMAAPDAITGGAVDTDVADFAGSAAPAAADADYDTDVADAANTALMDDELDLSALDVDLDADTDARPADETITEADTYLAYGLHQQAEDLLRLALEESPERHDYHEKLLETLHAAGKPDAFASAADNFRNRLDDVDAPAWQRVRAMGQEIAPGHALFSGAAGANAAANAAAGPPVDAGDDDDLDLDLGASDLGVDFDADAPAEDTFTQVLRAEAQNAGDETPAAELAGVDGAGGDADADDDLTFDLSDLDEASPAQEASAPQSPSAVDPGIEFDVSDLGLDDAGASAPAKPSGDGGGGAIDTSLDFDLGDFDLGETPETLESAAPAAPTAPADAGAGEAGPGTDLDDALELGESIGEAGDGGFDLDATLDVADMSDTNAAAADLDALESTSTVTLEAETAADPLTDAGASGAGDELEGPVGDDAPVVEFDFSSLEQELDQAGAVSGDGDGGGDDIPGEDLATMLDLAKAYIDMGDAESAATALEEVIAGGNDQQRAEARSLLETVQ